MKNIVKLEFTFGFVISLLLMTQCDKFSSIDFLTKNNFTMDAASQEFNVETKQQTSIRALTVNENMYSTTFDQILYNDTLVYYENDFSVQYVKYEGGEGVIPIEIIGEWFYIKKLDPFSTTTHIFIDENNEDSERSLIIKIGGALLHDNNIIIRQKKKGG